MKIQYKTILNRSAAEMEEKKSKFIASVSPVSSEEEALKFIDEISSKYWDATHNVYAYYIENGTTLQRFSDDGEPSGTAGMPALEVIKRMDVQNLVVVITRYFGGTLLGAAGLIRAYSKSTVLGIESAEIVTRKLCIVFSLMMEYTIFGKVQSFVLQEGYPVKDVIYGQDVEMLVYIPCEEAEAFNADIIDKTNGRIIVEMGEKAYITLDKNGKLIST